MSSVDIDYVLTRGVEEIIPDKKTLAALMETRKITLYQGFDPTAPSLHIGHFIGIRKLAQFQKLGHKVVFLIGDFTAMIGDPTDKKSARQKLSKDQVLANLKDYKNQVSKIINFEGSNPAMIKLNSEWLGKLKLEETIEIASNFTVQQLIERDMFQVRLKENKPIYLHEFLYPLMVGFDSKILGVDLEIGGSDQLFNMLAGRTLQKLDGKDKCVMTMKLLTDSNGFKMGKSEGNALFLSSSASDIFGKIMSWPDNSVNSAIELLTDLEINQKGISPMELKKLLAFEVVSQLKGDSEAVKAKSHFENTFQKGEADYKLQLPLNENLLKTIAPFTPNQSISDAKRLISQGGVDVNGEKVIDLNLSVVPGDKIKIGTQVFGVVVK